MEKMGKEMAKKDTLVMAFQKKIDDLLMERD